MQGALREKHKQANRQHEVQGAYLGPLNENTRREMSVSVTMTINLPRMLLYVIPGF